MKVRPRAMRTIGGDLVGHVWQSPRMRLWTGRVANHNRLIGWHGSEREAIIELYQEADAAAPAPVTRFEHRSQEEDGRPSQPRLT